MLLKRHFDNFTADPARLANILYERRTEINRPNTNVRKSYIPTTYDTQYDVNNNLPSTNYRQPTINGNTVNDISKPWTDDNLSMFGETEHNYYPNYGKMSLCLNWWV